MFFVYLSIMPKIQKAFKFRIKTNTEIENKLTRFCGSARFLMQLEYKLSWKGGMLVDVDYLYTSQTCSCCGHTSKENRPLQAVFKCLACGHEENADINAARNILTVGQTGMACQANRVGGRQQEPARNREEVLSKAS